MSSFDGQRGFSANARRSSSRHRPTANQENSWMDNTGRQVSRGKDEGLLWGGISQTKSQILEEVDQKRAFRSMFC